MKTIPNVRREARLPPAEEVPPEPSSISKEANLSPFARPSSDDQGETYHDLVAALVRIVGTDGLIADVEGRRVYSRDASGLAGILPLAVVFPATVEALSSVLKYCFWHQINVYARGGGTSLWGAATPELDGIVVCLSRMNRIRNIDLNNGTVTVESGVTSAAVDAAVARHGFRFAPIPCAGQVSTLGGNLATQASWHGGLMAGRLADHVVDVTMVRMDGEIVPTQGGCFGAPTYDVAGLLAGSEGQLGLIAEVCVRVVPRPPAQAVLILTFGDIRTAGACAVALTNSGLSPTSVLFCDRETLDLVRFADRFGVAGDKDVRAAVFVTLEGRDDEVSTLLAWMQEISAPFAPLAVTPEMDEDRCIEMQRWLGGVYGATGQFGDGMPVDGAVRLQDLATALVTVSEVGQPHGVRVATHVHVGSGPIRSVVLFDRNESGVMARAGAAQSHIHKIFGALGGVVRPDRRAVGGQDVPGLERSVTSLPVLAEPVDETTGLLQRRLKHELDPNGLLNPRRWPLRQDGRPTRAASMPGSSSEIAADSSGRAVESGAARSGLVSSIFRSRRTPP